MRLGGRVGIEFELFWRGRWVGVMLTLGVCFGGGGAGWVEDGQVGFSAGREVSSFFNVHHA